MSRFLKVRAASGPKHEFFAAVEEVEANGDAYEVIDEKPVDTPGPIKYVTETPAAETDEEPAAGGPKTTTTSTKGQSK